MSFGTATLDAHWNFFQPKVLVSYVPYDNTTDANIGADTVEDIQAIVEQATKEDYEYGQSEGVHQQLKNWNLRLSMLEGVVVTKNGKIVDPDGKAWIVIKTEKKSFNTRWKCLCYALEG